MWRTYCNCFKDEIPTTVRSRERPMYRQRVLGLLFLDRSRPAMVETNVFPTINI